MALIANLVTRNTQSLGVTYVALTGAGGDRAPAVWKAEAHSTYPTNQPILTCESRWNGPKTARVVKVDLRHPHVRTESGVEKAYANTIFSMSCIVPSNVPATEVKDALLEFASALNGNQAIPTGATNLLQDSIVAGFAPA